MAECVQRERISPNNRRRPLLTLTLKFVIVADHGVVTMSFINTGQMTRRPAHPGEMLREDFMPEYGLSVSALARAIGVS